MFSHLLLLFTYLLTFAKLTIFPLYWIIKLYRFYENWGVNMSAIPLMNLQLSWNQDGFEGQAMSR